MRTGRTGIDVLMVSNTSDGSSCWKTYWSHYEVLV